MEAVSYPKRLIEVDLPIRRISVHAGKEKSIRHGHISTLHIWWARRPLVACRAAVIGALLQYPEESKRALEIVDFVTRFCTWRSSTDSKMIEEARNLVLQGSRTIRPRVLDCFAGGGAIPLEALRIGSDAYALELNPVAVLLDLCTLGYPQRYGRSTETEV